jgi:hypothetical protein
VNAARTLLTGLTLVAATGVQASTTSAASSMAVPAQWRTYDILVSFRDLPRTYSCDDLWYKFRDVLLQLGARAYMTLTPYDCGYVGGGEARSPSVEAKFELPQPLHGAATRYADVAARNDTVHFEPGSPPSLHAQDCELVKQLQGTLLAALPLRVSASAYHCRAAPASFALTLNAPIAARAPRGQAGAAAVAIPHS